MTAFGVEMWSFFYSEV